jgi:hypothetical protein
MVSFVSHEVLNLPSLTLAVFAGMLLSEKFASTQLPLQSL